MGVRLLEAALDTEQDSFLPAKSASSRSELAFKAELEARTGIAFEQARPDWLRNPETGAALELDMYSRERRLAVCTRRSRACCSSCARSCHRVWGDQSCQ